PIAALNVTTNCSISSVESTGSAPGLKLATPFRPDSLWGSAMNVYLLLLAIDSAQCRANQCHCGMPLLGGGNPAMDFSFSSFPALVWDSVSSLRNTIRGRVAR